MHTIYALALMAVQVERGDEGLERGRPAAVAMVVVADTRDAALGEGFRRARLLFPEAQGYREHMVSLCTVDPGMLRLAGYDPCRSDS